MANETIPAGCETDRQIAAEVFDCIVAPSHCCGMQGFGAPGDRCPACDFERPPAGVRWLRPNGVPRYSTWDTAALEVVEALRRRGWLVILKAMPDGLPFLAGASWGPGEGQEIPVRYVASGQWMRHLTPADTGLRVSAHPVGMADTLALAVCRMALQCVTAEREAER